LTNTDHDHLGKLLTYAAGQDARSVIWLTREFRDEHRQALDWLNQRTDESTEFYGVEVEVFKIDESAPAPHFKVVASPNNWSKQTKTDTSHNLSPKAIKYRSFFQQLIDELRDVHHFTAAKIGQPNSYYYFSGGHTAIKYGASFVLGSNARIELNIDGDKESNKRLFDNLEEIKSELEEEFGESFTWERLDNAQSSRVSVYRPGNIEDSEDVLDEIRQWMISNLLRFKEIFAQRLPDLMN